MPGMKAKRIKAQCLLSLLIAGTVLAACSSSGRRVRIEGRFLNMNQAELYLLDVLHGRKDTIAVRSGRFAFETSQSDTVTYLLMFPNYSLLPVFTYPGATIGVEGDASHLRETKVTGTDENDDMTQLRLQAAKQTPPEAKASARQYIASNPASPVSLYLLEHYFLQEPEPNYAEASRLCRTMTAQGGAVARLEKQLQMLKNGQLGSRLPQFTLKDTQGKTVNEQQLRSKANVVCLWASWHYESKNIMTQLHKMQRQHPQDISVVSVCIDATPEEGRDFLKHDTIDWPNICDGKMWQTPLATRLGFASLPANVIADKNGKIVARNLASINDVKKHIENIIGTK